MAAELVRVARSEDDREPEKLRLVITVIMVFPGKKQQNILLVLINQFKHGRNLFVFQGRC